MAAGDITISGAGVAGNKRTIWGTLEADSTLRSFKLSRNSLIDCMLTCTTDTATGRVTLNQDASGNTAAGTAAIRSDVRTAVPFQFLLSTIG